MCIIVFWDKTNYNQEIVYNRILYIFDILMHICIDYIIASRYPNQDTEHLDLVTRKPRIHNISPLLVK